MKMKTLLYRGEEGREKNLHGDPGCELRLGSGKEEEEEKVRR